MEAGLPISKENFRRLESPEAKLDALFDYLVYASTEKCDSRLKHCLELFRSHHLEIEGLKKRRRTDTAVAGGSGFLGGFVAVLAKIKFLGG